jgi:hypothetical protein
MIARALGRALAAYVIWRAVFPPREPSTYERMIAELRSQLGEEPGLFARELVEWVATELDALYGQATR